MLEAGRRLLTSGLLEPLDAGGGRLPSLTSSGSEKGRDLVLRPTPLAKQRVAF